ncbi:DUF4302 domain-containing protein [Chitinophaga nivalis]|uniref:DUF4302 domain-containing protein n=1 Tax=Chitinophaga nivalis TaxID=2991709 RepID=A0ABT3IEM3_9BACT|nr:DUF4302 domain-containing protein [Chitinophaga nivalis]MCW3467904.1 DUF4302 domain-containing protein [Chitinophaga nivalis]MCW3482405.1 DUF4302 domain-containing protein [Chitinophaga nivalis]
MKKTALYILIFTALLSACRKSDNTDYPVEKSFPENTKTLEEFRQTMAGAPNGWEGTLLPQGGQQYLLFFQLDNSKGEVTLYADANANSAAVPSKSGYSISTSQVLNPTLTFAAGSRLQDILLAGNRSVDTAYSFQYIKGDTVILQGNRFGDELRLVKATAEAKTAYTAGKLAENLKGINGFLKQGGFYAIYNGQDSTQTSIDTTKKNFAFYNVSSYKLNKAASTFSYSLKGISFRKPLTVYGQAISEAFWDESNKGIYVNIGAGKVYLQPKRFPVTPLCTLLGDDYAPVISMPSPVIQGVPGWSTAFFNMWVVSHNLLLDEGVLLSKIDFDFADAVNTMTLNVYFDESPSRYVGKFYYNYTLSPEGFYTFTLKAAPAGNAAFLAPHVKNFTDWVTKNRFKVDYYYNQSAKLIQGRLVSVEQPTIFCVGYFGTFSK